MRDSTFRRVEAIHPHWHGFLRLSAEDSSIVHEGVGSTGAYELNDGKLTVKWDKYAAEVFSECFGKFIHEQILKEIPAAEHMFAVSLNRRIVAATKVTVVVPNTSYEVELRLNSSDILTFDQIFGKYEYESQDLPKSARVIVDLGANVGLAAVFFGLRYPEAQILCVEPEEHNFSLLTSNTSAFGTRIQNKLGAVWVSDGYLGLQTESVEGVHLDAWGVRTTETVNDSDKLTRCYRLDTLLDDAGLTKVDILKVDIEGAELRVFSEGSEKWLSRVDMIVIETHDRFQPGSEDAVRNAIRPMFAELPSVGENLFFKRIESTSNGQNLK